MKEDAKSMPNKRTSLSGHSITASQHPTVIGHRDDILPPVVVRSVQGVRFFFLAYSWNRNRGELTRCSVAGGRCNILLLEFYGTYEGVNDAGKDSSMDEKERKIE